MYDTNMNATQVKINQLAHQAYAQAITNNNQQLASLLTRKEKIILGRRILIAQAIIAGKTRSEITALMQISPNTFAQVKHWLEDELREYSSAHHLPADTTTTPEVKSKQPAQAFSYQHMKQRYPGHFLLFSLTEELFKLAKK